VAWDHWLTQAALTSSKRLLLRLGERQDCGSARPLRVGIKAPGGVSYHPFIDELMATRCAHNLQCCLHSLRACESRRGEGAARNRCRSFSFHPSAPSFITTPPSSSIERSLMQGELTLFVWQPLCLLCSVFGSLLLQYVCTFPAFFDSASSSSCPSFALFLTVFVSLVTRC